MPCVPSVERSFPQTREQKLGLALGGLILTIALLGELNSLEVNADQSVGWLLGWSVVLWGANVVSTLVAHLAVTRSQPTWRELAGVVRMSLPVVLGPVGAGVLMMVPAVGNFDTDLWLVVPVVVGLVLVGVLTLYATAFLQWWMRLVSSLVVVGFCILIVIAENTL